MTGQARRDPVVDPLLEQAWMCRSQGDWDGAQAALEAAVGHRSDHVHALTTLGLLLNERGQTAAALALHRQALAIDPGYVGALSNFAVALQDNGEHDEAYVVLQRAVALAPNVVEPLVNLGLMQLGRGLPRLAFESFRRALQLQPGLVDTWINLGIALQECGDAEGSCSAYREALRLNPGDRRALSNLQMVLQYTPDISFSQLRTEAASAGRYFGSALPLPDRLPWKAGVRRLRVGYVSSDLFRHPVGTMAQRMLMAHDKLSIEVFCYAGNRVSDDVTAELRGSIEHWHDVIGWTDERVRELILSHGVDVLIDLGGHTANSRLGVFAMRAAPAQMAWLGFTGSTGISAMDAVLLGPNQCVEGTAEAYSESVVSLPRCPFTFLPPHYAPSVTPPPQEKNSFLTFGSFNNPGKLTAPVYGVWARILREVANSRLVLKWRSLVDPWMMHQIRTRFAGLGVEPERIELRGASRHPEMLAEYADIDIALDPFPFCGGLTTCEALWMGVPVISLLRRRPISRQGLEILACVGLSEFATNTPAQYVAVARALAADAPHRKALREDLRRRMEKSPLFDGVSLARALEEAYSRLAAVPGR